MRNNYAPKPLIENHYHIEELIERQQKRTDDRNRHSDLQKEKDERNMLINDAHLVAIADFHCDICRSDFRSMAIKQIERDWNDPSIFIAFYKSKCDTGHWCIRLITDKLRDGYWMRSLAVARDRGNHYKDIVQPFETGYNMLYGKK